MKETLLALTVGSGSSVYKVTAPSGIASGGLTSIETTITWGIEVLLILATVICLFVMLYGGFLWMTSAGDEKKVGAARNVLIYAIIGLVVCFLSFTIAELVATFLGISIFFGK